MEDRIIGFDAEFLGQMLDGTIEMGDLYCSLFECIFVPKNGLRLINAN